MEIPGVNDWEPWSDGVKTLDNPFRDPGPQKVTLNGEQVSCVISGAPDLGSPWGFGNIIEHWTEDVPPGLFTPATVKGASRDTGEIAITPKPTYLSEATIYSYAMKNSIFTQDKVNPALKTQFIKFLEEGIKDMRKSQPGWGYRKSLPYPKTGQELPLSMGSIPDKIQFSPDEPIPMAAATPPSSILGGPVDPFNPYGFGKGPYYTVNYIPQATWRTYEKNIAQQVADSYKAPPPDKPTDPSKPTPLRKPGDLSQYLDNSKGVVNTKADFDTNAMVDPGVGFDLTNVGVSKESCEMVGLGAIPVMFYCSKVGTWKWLAYYTAASPITAYAITKLLHEPLDYNLREWNRTVNNTGAQVEVTSTLWVESLQNLEYIWTKGIENAIPRFKSPAFLIPAGLAAIPVGYSYYQTKNKSTLALYGVFCASVPFVEAALEKFYETHKIMVVGVGGITGTLAVASLLYSTGLIPPPIIGEIGAVGFAGTGLVCAAMWIKEEIDGTVSKVEGAVSNPLSLF